MPEEAQAATVGGVALNLRERRWHLLVFTAVGSFMAPFDGSVVAVALPKMSAALQLGFIGAVWVQAAYLLAMTVVLIPLGRLADSYGRLRFYRAGLLGFAVTSLLAALSRDVTWLLAARVAQGLSSALLAANGAALIAEAFPPHERGRALGLNSTAVYLGLALGPVLGGVLTQQLGWRSIFLVNVPIALLTLWWGRALAEEQRRGVRAAPDLLGTAFWAVALCAGLIAVTEAPVWGWSAPLSAGLFAIAVLALAGFVWAEVRQGTPMLDLGRLVHNRLFAAGSAAALLNYTAFFGITTLTAIFLEVGSGRSAQAAGLLLLVQPLLMVSLSALAGRLSDRYGSRWLATGGMLLIVVGLVLLSTLPAAASFPRLEAALGLVGIGMAAFSAPNTAAVMGRGRPGPVRHRLRDVVHDALSGPVAIGGPPRHSRHLAPRPCR